jgi:hypothetical protein
MSDAYISVQDRTEPELALVLDPDSLDKNLHYRFVDDRPTNVARKKALGYRVVSRTKDKVRTAIELEHTSDDTIRHADMILMCAPKEKVLERRRGRRELVKSRLQATEDNFKEKVAKARASGVDVRLVDSFDQRGEPSDGKEEE